MLNGKIVYINIDINMYLYEVWLYEMFEFFEK